MNIELSEDDKKFLKEFVHEIETQDTHCTAKPIFYRVRTKKEYISHPDYSHDRILYRVDFDTCLKEDELKEYFDENVFDNEMKQDFDEWKDELEVIAVQDIDHFDNIFFTEKGYHQHIKMNGHNYDDPHFYIDHVYRNPEIENLLSVITKISKQMP